MIAFKLNIFLIIVMCLFLQGSMHEVLAEVNQERETIISHDLKNFIHPLGDWILAANVALKPTDQAQLLFESNTGNSVVNGTKGKTKHLFTKAEYGDVKLNVEFMIPIKSNSGLYFQGRYEVQIFDSWGVKSPQFSDCGGIYQRWKNNRGYEGRSPRSNASKKPGEWQSYEIIFRAPRFDEKGNKISNAVFERVVLNGVLIQEAEELSGPTRSSAFEDEKPMGPLMIQGDHGPVAIRNLQITPLHQR